MGEQLNETPLLINPVSNQPILQETEGGGGIGEISTDNIDPIIPVKRGRGRPPKTGSASPSVVVSGNVGSGRGRGRPRKDPYVSVDGTGSSSKKSVGRPRKEKDPLSVATTMSKVKSPGRPRKQRDDHLSGGGKGTESSVTTTKVESKTITTISKGSLGVDESDTTTTTTTTETTTTTTTTVVKTV